MAGLTLSGINAEVMPGQWEFQIGPCGPLEVSDQIWLARWLLYRIGEDYNVSATLDPKIGLNNKTTGQKITSFLENINTIQLKKKIKSVMKQHFL